MAESVREHSSLDFLPFTVAELCLSGFSAQDDFL